MLCRVTSPSVTLFLSPVLFSFYLPIYLFLAMVGLCYCPQAFSSCSEQGLLCLRCTGFSLQWLLFGAQALGAWTSIVVVMSELSSCRSQALGMQAQKSWCMGLVVLQHVGSSWTRNQTSGVLALQVGFLTPGPPVKPQFYFLIAFIIH